MSSFASYKASSAALCFSSSSVTLKIDSVSFLNAFSSLILLSFSRILAFSFLTFGEGALSCGLLGSAFAYLGLETDRLLAL
jgi:hypothetical protein